MIEKNFVQQAYKKIQIEDFFRKNLNKAGFSSVEIVKTPMATKIILTVAKPGLAIGYSGKNVKKLTQILETKYEIKNPVLEIKPIENPEYNAQHIVNSIIGGLERNFSWRSVVYKAVKELTATNLEGFELLVKGKLMAKGGRKQKYRVPFGYMKKAGDQVSKVKVGTGAAYTKSGAIGITLKLIPPGTVFPDKISKDEILDRVNKLYATMSEDEKKEVEALDKEQKK
jgi:small subunit ribosomal protein S3